MNPFAALIGPGYLPPPPAVKKPVSANPRYVAVRASNPWGLTTCQLSALASFAEFGTYVSAAIAKGVSTKTIDGHVNRAAKKMGAHNRVVAAILYDRWKQVQA